jgi:nucleoside-diphosphate-sugar epimerase
LRDALKNQDVLVNVASLGFGHAHGILTACQEANIKRAVFFSTTAVLTTLAAPSKVVRMEAEKLIRESNIDYTIIRPTMIYGSLGDRNMIRLIRFIYRSPVVPIFGDGKSLLQPVFVQDLAKAVSNILKNDNTKNKVYHLSGKEPLTYNAVIDTVAEKLNKRVIKMHVPVSLSMIAIKLAKYIPGFPHITPEQVLRLNENKAFSHEEAGNDFGYSPLSFDDGIAKEIAEFMGSK